MKAKRVRKTPKRLSRSKYQLELPRFDKPPLEPPKKRLAFRSTQDSPKPTVETVSDNNDTGDAADSPLHDIWETSPASVKKAEETFQDKDKEQDTGEDRVRTPETVKYNVDQSPVECKKPVDISTASHESQGEASDDPDGFQAEDDQPEDEGGEDNLPEDTTVYLSRKEWSTIYPDKVNGGGCKLEGSWTTLLSEKISRYLPECVFAFKLNRVRKLLSRKKNSPFFRGRAVCTREMCCVVAEFMIKGKPSSQGPVPMTVTFSGKQRHTRKAAKRQLRGVHRAKTAVKANREGVMNFYYDRVGEMRSQEIQEGNITHCQIPSVLRKAVSEWVGKDILHHETVQEILLLKEAYKDNDLPLDADNAPYPGYIHSVGADPFNVILFSRDQIRLMCNNCNGDYYFDATGSIMRNIPNQKMPLLYAFVLQVDGAPPVSVADLLTTSHNIPNITHFLLSLKRACVSKRHHLQPRKIETDWSWAMVQSCLVAFNSMTVKKYLNTSWRICRKMTSDIEAFTVIHTCSSHMTKNLFSFLKSQPNLKKRKSVQEFVIRSFVLLCNSTDLESSKRTFDNLCLVLLSPDHNSSVKDIIKRSEKLEHPEQSEEITSSTCPRDELENLDEKTIAESSPFFEFFNNSIQHYRRYLQSEDIVENEYHNPELLDTFTKKYMSIFPLWSGILLGSLERYTDDNPPEIVTETRSSNAPAEGWFKTVKLDVLKRKTKLRPALLITKLKRSVNGRVKEIENANILRPLVSKRKRKSVVDLSEEQWSKKKKRRTKYHPPKQIASKRIVRPSSSATVTDPFPSVPKWGGKCVGKYLSNTCTLDNFLAIIHVHNLETPNFEALCRLNMTTTTTKLLDTLGLMAEEKFAMAKLSWLADTEVSKSRHVDLYGSEFEVFVNELLNCVETKTQNTCTNSKCLHFHQQRNARGISLSASQSKEDTNTIQDMVSRWMKPCTMPCKSEQHTQVEEGPHTQTKQCSGVRTLTRKVLSLPPVLVLTLADLVQTGHLSPDVTTYTQIMRVGNLSYRLAGITLHKADHFTGVVNSTRHGWLHYDGLEGNLKKFRKAMLTDCTPSQAVYVIYEQLS